MGCIDGKQHLFIITKSDVRMVQQAVTYN